MGIAHTTDLRVFSEPTPTTYTIYTFQAGLAAPKKHERWHKHDTMTDCAETQKRAETLFDSGDYSRVEIKQRITDPKSGRVNDSTFKVFKRRDVRSLRAALFTIILATASVIGCALAYAVTGHG